jgi:dTDP-4-dehydrorhamnose reductase
VTGAAGLVGSWLVAHPPESVDAVPTTRADTDLADQASVLALVERVRPDAVIHAAYGTAELEGDVVRASVNVPDPVTPYGQAKAAVEADLVERCPEAALVRTSLVCATDPPDPRTAAVLDALRAGQRITLYTDELRSPVRVDDLGRGLWTLARMSPRSRTGTWHLVGPESLSRYTLGVLVAAWAGLDPAGITPALVEEHPERRPRDTRLSTRASVLPGAVMRPIGSLFTRSWSARPE